MKKSMSILVMGALIFTSLPTWQGQAYAAEAAVQNVQQGQIISGVNLRSKPSLSGSIIGFVGKGSVVTILEQSNDYFYKVRTSEGTTGYLSAADKYISVQKAGSSTAAGVVIYGVNLRDKPSTSGKVIKMLSKGTKVTIVDQSNSYFYKVETENGLKGYVSTSSKYLKINGKVTSPTPSPSPGTLDSAKIEQVIRTGQKYLGTPYEYGSDRNTTDTFDCSDFVRQAYRESIGIVLPADSRKQGAWIRDNGTAVYSMDSLKRGDLVFFMSYKGSSASSYAGVNPNTERITHVGIYLGNGEILHTYSNSSGGVRKDKLTGSWKHRFLYGGSVLK
ncbi:C40 family peptidase [Paenibacillus antibioticophila]|uniref:C40 family peptidase n=1 Tax=Paenibacillus antibioticophila TaxID=1274374 RepID=UPI0005C99D25|nr:C40 family peptidase [Paenibacillus antibioticophila]